MEGDAVGLEGANLLIGGSSQQGGDDGVQLCQGGGRLHQQHFKLAVIQNHIVVLHPLETTHRNRVGNHAVDEVPFLYNAVMLDGHGVAGDVGQTLDAFQHISCVP